MLTVARFPQGMLCPDTSVNSKRAQNGESLGECAVVQRLGDPKVVGVEEQLQILEKQAG